MSPRRLISLMALAVLSVLAVGAPVAQANHPDDTMASAECVLTPGGVAGSAALLGEDGVNSVQKDTNNGFAWDSPTPMLMDTDPGHFNFTGNATCEGTDRASEANNATTPEPIPPGAYTIIASGDFDNQVCGTGTANGDAVIRNANASVQIFTEFSIHFVGGVGAGGAPPYAGKLFFVVDADETGGAPVGGQRPTAPDGAETWAGSLMAAEYGMHGGHSYAFTGPPGSPPPPANGNQIDGGGGSGDVTITPSGGNCATTNVTTFLVNGQFEGFLSGEGSDVSAGPTTTDSDA